MSLYNRLNISFFKNIFMPWEEVKYIYPHLTNESRKQNELPIISEGTTWFKSTKTLGYFVFQNLKEEKRNKNKGSFHTPGEKGNSYSNQWPYKGRKKELSLYNFIEILLKLGTWSSVIPWPISHEPIGLRNQITLQ